MIRIRWFSGYTKSAAIGQPLIEHPVGWSTGGTEVRSVHHMKGLLDFLPNSVCLSWKHEGPILVIYICMLFGQTLIGAQVVRSKRWSILRFCSMWNPASNSTGFVCSIVFGTFSISENSSILVTYDYWSNASSRSRLGLLGGRHLSRLAMWIMDTERLTSSKKSEIRLKQNILSCNWIRSGQSIECFWTNRLINQCFNFMVLGS